MTISQALELAGALLILAIAAALAITIVGAAVTVVTRSRR